MSRPLQLPDEYVHGDGVRRNQRTFVKPAEISVWGWEPWIGGRRPPTTPILHHVMPVHGPGDVWHMKVEINNDTWTWSGPCDAISGPFRLTVKVPDLSGRGMPTELERFLDQEIGI